MRKLTYLLIVMLLLVGCSDTERLATVETVNYSNAEITVMFKDGIIITTSEYDEGINAGDSVYVTHKRDGITIRKTALEE